MRSAVTPSTSRIARVAIATASATASRRIVRIAVADSSTAAAASRISIGPAVIVGALSFGLLRSRRASNGSRTQDRTPEHRHAGTPTDGALRDQLLITQSFLFATHSPASLPPPVGA